jgi:hypothetical protein
MRPSEQRVPRVATALLCAALLWPAQAALAQFTQQGPKLVGTGPVGKALQGGSVALSGDGNTAIVGGSNDDGRAGAAWVFTRSAAQWKQQGTKLVGIGAVGSAQGGGAKRKARQGSSVALSGDGNTVIMGGPDDNGSAGAAWVFTRSGGVWSQQRSKLVGSGGVGAAYQGFSVALSGDGNTVMIGGPHDNSSIGATWVFTRSGGVWSQQAKLVGAGGVGFGQRQGNSVALSGDGNTAIVGGPDDDYNTGAAWVFTRSGGQWKQLGVKLVGTGASAKGSPAGSTTPVALSGDGNTAIIGRPNHNANIGAAWVFTRSGGQ